MSKLLKDDRLASIAGDYNVAQFASFDTGNEPLLRHWRIRTASGKPNTAEDAVEALFHITESVNVRTFSSAVVKGAPFHYGMRTVDDTLALIRKYAADGLYTIVNETVDVHDGGVSGVSLGGVVEFSPEDTPRAVEKAGTVLISRTLATEMLKIVYGVDLDLPPSNQRAEFSVHPQRVGYRRTHTLLWDIEESGHVELPWRLSWPNRFSTFIGDKAFGLLVAHLLGAPVPYTTVISRRVAPFSFGLDTGTQEYWFRTCPTEKVAGKFPTVFGWSDPFSLISQIDPLGTKIASVLAQKAVDANYSGASLPDARGVATVEGVKGRGDLFMLGQVKPEPVPGTVADDLKDITKQIQKVLGPVRTEWAHDGVVTWLLQVNLTDKVSYAGVINPGEATHWLAFDPAHGLDRLRQIAAEAQEQGAGVVVTDWVGTTSHVGDILREAGIPARIRLNTVR